MGCLLHPVVVLTVVLAIFAAAWMWFGVMGVIVTFVVLVFLLGRFGPRMLAAGARRAFQDLGANMRDAAVVVHGVTLADPPDDVADMLDRLDVWIDERRADEESSGPMSIEVDECFAGSEPEFNLDEARYLIDVTITPPATESDAAWVPAVLSVTPTAEANAFAGGNRRIELFDEATATFRPCSDEETTEVRGSQRLRLLFSLDPRQREYQFVYLHVIRIGTSFEIPAPAWEVEPRRRFTAQAIDRIVARRDVGSASLNYLPVIDADLIKIAQLADLEFLGLDGTQIDDEGVKHLAGLKKLEGLTLNDTRISDAGLTSLHELKQLKRIWLRDTTVTDAGLHQLKQALPGIEIIR